MERPRIKIRLTTFDYIVEIFSILSVLGSIVLYVIYRINPPEVVPMHYNIHGEVDGYGGSKAVLIILPIINILTYAVLTILNKYPHIFNFPTAVTEENAFFLYKSSTRMVRQLKLLIALLIAFLVWYLEKGITLQEHTFYDILLWLFYASVIICPIFLIVKINKKMKKQHNK